MSHVDEGNIHAYLDRQLEFAEPAAREALEAHVAECADCAALLDDARTLHTEATAVLRMSEPTTQDPPPFEVVTARAEGGAGRRTPTIARMRTLAWAASIVLAVAVGWYARPSFTNRTREAGVPTADVGLRSVASELQVEPAAESAAARGAVTFNTPETQPTVAPLDRRELQAAEQVVAAAVRESIGVFQARQAAAEAEGIRADRDNEIQALVQQRLARAAPRPEREQRRVADEVAEIAPVRARTTLADAPSLAEADQLAGVGGDGFAEGGAWREVDRTTAEQVLGTAIVAVDDLPIVGIFVPASGRAQVRVRQTLPSGRLLDLHLRRGTTAAPVAAAVTTSGALAERSTITDSTAMVILRVGELLVSGRAAVGRDSLTALLGRLREPPRLD